MIELMIEKVGGYLMQKENTSQKLNLFLDLAIEPK